MAKETTARIVMPKAEPEAKTSKPKAKVKPEAPEPKTAKVKREKKKPEGAKAACYRLLANDPDLSVEDLVKALAGRDVATGTIRATRRSFRNVMSALRAAGVVKGK